MRMAAVVSRNGSDSFHGRLITKVGLDFRGYLNYIPYFGVKSHPLLQQTELL